MSEPRTARDHALCVAALEAAAAAFTEAYEKARAAAEPVFAAKYAEEGNDRQMVLLPSGERVSQITVKAPPAVVTWASEDALEDWVREHLGDEGFEDFIPESVMGSREVLDIIRTARPELTGRRIRPATRKKLTEQVVKSGGWLEDKASGEKERVADVCDGPVTGAFAFTGNDRAQRHARLMTELVNGRLREVIEFGPLALPGGGDPDAS